MLEIVPQRPYTSQTQLQRLSKCIEFSKKLIESHLNEDEKLQSISVLTLFRSSLFSDNTITSSPTLKIQPNTKITLTRKVSIFMTKSSTNTPDSPTFPIISANDVRKKLTFWYLSIIIKFQIPIFKDQNTKLDEIHMDAMAFGMGNCCLQTTFSCTSID